MLSRSFPIPHTAASGCEQGASPCRIQPDHPIPCPCGSSPRCAHAPPGRVLVTTAAGRGATQLGEHRGWDQLGKAVAPAVRGCCTAPSENRSEGGIHTSAAPEPPAAEGLMASRPQHGTSSSFILGFVFGVKALRMPL